MIKGVPLRTSSEKTFLSPDIDAKHYSIFTFTTVFLHILKLLIFRVMDELNYFYFKEGTHPDFQAHDVIVVRARQYYFLRYFSGGIQRKYV